MTLMMSSCIVIIVLDIFNMSNKIWISVLQCRVIEKDSVQNMPILSTEDKFVMTMLVLGIRKYIPLSFCISLSLRLHEIQKLRGI